MSNPAEPRIVAGAASGESSSATAHGTEGDAVMHSGAADAGEITAHHGRPPTPIPYPPYHGRRVSWVAVSLMMLGFVIGGLALVIGTNGPTWWLFWLGAGISVVGLLTMIATNTFEDWY